MDKKLFIANWKMNPLTVAEAVDLAKASDCEGVVIAAPFLFLEKIGGIIKTAKLGAQDLYWEEKGAFTGEISPKQLKNMGVSYVIIGHSERRHKMGETDEMTAKKVLAAIDHSLVAVLCVGETEKEKIDGKTERVLERQLKIGLSLVAESNKLSEKNLIIAYEPVWAIGTGNPQTPEGAVETSGFIKQFLSNNFGLNIKVLYGGSVNSQNFGNFIKYKEIDGALVGGASLKKDEVKEMVNLI